MSKTKQIPSKLIDGLLLLSKRRCALCYRTGKTRPQPGSFAHIERVARGEEETLDNLVYLCAQHHAGFDRQSPKKLSSTEVRAARDELYSAMKRQNSHLMGGTPMNTRAVVFTHFGSLKYRSGGKEFHEILPVYEEIYKKIFGYYLQCPSISIVYIYIDWAFKQVVPRIGTIGKFVVDPNLNNEEEELIDLLRGAERGARAEHRTRNSSQPTPVFEFVGITKLLKILNDLVALNPDLTRYLCGPSGQFTYDSPKFVEAVIRLARGDTPHLARHPIIRVDEDAYVNDNSIKKLIYKYEELINIRRFFFFSGTYGTEDDYKTEDDTDDFINDYAVRTHWFVPPRVRGKGEPTSDKEELERQPLPPENKRAIQSFLADFDGIGARQLPDSREHHTEDYSSIVWDDVRSRRSERPSTQVISGAGLIMSSRAVRFLPPFMNFENLTTWVDDHLKRRLHEALEDLSRKDTECVREAKFRQNRHPDGIGESDIEWAIGFYFDRLLRGCIFRRIITENSGKPSSYSKLVAEMMKFKVTGSVSGLIRINFLSPDDSHGKAFEEVDLNPYRLSMLEAAQERYEEVLKCWSSSEYDRKWENHEGCLREWALNRIRAKENPSPRLDNRDYLVPSLLLKKLLYPAGEPSIYLSSRLKEVLRSKKDREQKLSEMIDALNNLLDDPDFYDDSRFERIKLSKSTLESLEREPESSVLLNRELLQDAYPGIVPWWNHKTRTCEAVVKDALNYLILLSNWHIFVRAVERIGKFGNNWLYTPVAE